MQGHVRPSDSAEPYPHGRWTLLSRGSWAPGSQWSAGTRSDLAVGPGHDPGSGFLVLAYPISLLRPNTWNPSAALQGVSSHDFHTPCLRCMWYTLLAGPLCPQLPASLSLEGSHAFPPALESCQQAFMSCLRKPVSHQQAPPLCQL